MALKELLTGPVPTKIIPAELLRPSFYGMLMVYYFCLALYGLTAILFGVFSISSATSVNYTFIWSLLTFLVGGTAGVGVFISRRLKKEWIEVSATSIVLGLMSGYGVAILTHAIVSNHMSNVAAAWLPFLISILPTWRLMMIGLEGDLLNKHRRRER